MSSNPNLQSPEGGVEVIIATASRPQYLVSALHSVAAQGPPAAVRRVVVSENGGNTASQSIVEPFLGRLAIEYRLQSPPMPAADHLRRLFEDARGDYVAFLCDDDWWLDGHLSRSVRLLEAQPRAAACFSAALFCNGEHAAEGNTYFSQAGMIYLPLALRRCGPAVSPFEVVGFQAKELHAAAWVQTPFHFSTMVARRDALREAAKAIDSANFFNIDRLLEVALSRQGDILFFPQPAAGIRTHETNWATARKQRDLMRFDREAKVRIEASAQAIGADIAAHWQTVLPGCPPKDRVAFGRLVAGSSGWRGLGQLGVAHLVLRGGFAGLWDRCYARTALPVKDVVPARLFHWLKRLTGL